VRQEKDRGEKKLKAAKHQDSNAQTPKTSILGEIKKKDLTNIGF